MLVCRRVSKADLSVDLPACRLGSRPDESSPLQWQPRDAKITKVPPSINKCLRSSECREQYLHRYYNILYYITLYYIISYHIILYTYYIILYYIISCLILTYYDVDCFLIEFHGFMARSTMSLSNNAWTAR
jgi:hypothetical protein